MVNAAQSSPSEAAPVGTSAAFRHTFSRLQSQLEQHKAGEPVVVDGHTISIADVVAAARYASPVQLSSASEVRRRVDRSQQVIEAKLAAGHSVYGLSTGFGGSADTRTNAALVLGKSLLQHQHAGILPSPPKDDEDTVLPLPLNDPLSTSMPEAWVRAAILIRMNSLIRGHSGVRWKFIEALGDLLEKNITPFVPLRGSISASGDLSPLSYVAGTLIGNPSIRVHSTAPASKDCALTRRIVSSREAFSEHSLSHVTFEAKEHLGLLNGTAFSAGVASLALNDTMHVSILAMVATAMGTEALLGMQGSHAPFIHATARPHAGQVEAAATMFALLEGSKFAHTGEEKELSIAEDTGKLRQDRYSLRTSPQWLGPQMEDILLAVKQVETECNTTTDNPLVDGETETVHHGGNFQAMSVTSAMERTRLAIQHTGKLLFSQLTELLNPAFNRGLPPNLAASDPSVNYFAKGIDIASAAYVSELGWLANPVGTHVQSAEMHNQAVNSLALISGRATISSLEVLTMLTASYLYVLCQALDIRALQHEFDLGVQKILQEELEKAFTPYLAASSTENSLAALHVSLLDVVRETLDATTTKDAVPRLETVAQACTTPIVNFFLAPSSTSGAKPNGPPRSTVSSRSPTPPTDGLTNATESLSGVVGAIPAFRAALAMRSVALLTSLRQEYLSGQRGAAPAAEYLAHGTRPVYEFIRKTLGVRMHGWENINNFDTGAMKNEELSGELGFNGDEGTVGVNASVIYESIRDGRMQPVIAGVLASLN